MLDTWWASTAPSAETPIEPPIERKNATTELAAPMSARAALFCTASTRFCMVAPRPTPSDDHVGDDHDEVGVGVDGAEQREADDDEHHAADELALPAARSR